MYGLDMDKAVAQPKFKVGQRVRFTDAFNKNAWFFKSGQLATITSNDRFGGFTYTAIVEDGGKCYVDDEHIAPAFLEGDKVRVTRHSGYFATGDVGEVERQAEDVVFVKHGSYQRIGLPIDVNALELVASHGSSSDVQPSENVLRLKLELDTDGFTEALDAALGANRPCIVARVVGGTPRPSNIPYVHADVGSATTEAERLATNNPGQEFAVYQRVAGRIAEQHIEIKEVA